jgi:hypothetical protein
MGDPLKHTSYEIDDDSEIDGAVPPIGYRDWPKWKRIWWRVTERFK